MKKGVKIHTKEAYLDKVSALADTFHSMLATGHTSSLAVSTYLACSASFQNSGHRSKRCARRFQSNYNATREDTRRLAYSNTPHDKGRNYLSLAFLRRLSTIDLDASISSFIVLCEMCISQ
jgi:hypothetical protein